MSCLLPPSALSLLGKVLVDAEVGGAGLQWSNLSRSVTSQSEYPFSGTVVLLFLAFDCVLFGLLAFYLDRVSRSKKHSSFSPNFWIYANFG